MTRQMSAGSQVAFAKDWLERQGTESQTIDVAAHIDPSLSYEENIKSMKRQFGLGGGRSRQQAAPGLTAAECDVAIGNFEAGYNHGVARDACACGHLEACETKVAAAPKHKPAARKPKAKKVVTTKPEKLKCDWWKIPRDQWVDGHIKSPAMHKECVRLALARGYKVPAKVMRDYPEFKLKVAAAPKTKKPAFTVPGKPAARTAGKQAIPTEKEFYQIEYWQDPKAGRHPASGAGRLPMRYTAYLEHAIVGGDQMWKLHNPVTGEDAYFDFDDKEEAIKQYKNLYKKTFGTQKAAEPKKTAAARKTTKKPAVKPAPPELAADVLGAEEAALHASERRGELRREARWQAERKATARTTRKQAAKPKARKPKTKVAAAPKAKPKATKPKAKTPAAAPKLTATQREYLAVYGFVKVKRGGKFIKITK